LSLWFSAINDHERLKLPWRIRPPHLKALTTALASLGGVEFLGNAYGCSEGRSFEEMSNKSALTVDKADVCSG
jgi:hypothetical protein